MPRLWIAAIVAAVAALGVTPAVAQATTPTTTSITRWVSTSTDPQGHTTTITNGTYLLSLDNPPKPTTLAVSGTSNGTTGDHVDVLCYYGFPSQYKTLAGNLAVAANGGFSTPVSPPQLRLIAGRACRLRAVPTGHDSTGDVTSYAGPQLAISEAALPLSTISGGTVNPGKAYNYYVNGVTFTGYAAWKAAGTPAASGIGACGGPYAAPVDQAFDIGDSVGNNYPIDCAGSLLDDDLDIWGQRSEVRIDGHNAYDAASAQALFARTGGLDNGSEDMPGFPSLSASVSWDPTSGLISSQAQESWATCDGPDVFPATSTNCTAFSDTGVTLNRVITTSDGGRVITLTDTWMSTDHQSHSLDLLYDDYVGVFGDGDNERGWAFPGQSGFSQYTRGAGVAAPSSAPGSILARTNVSAADGDPNEGYGAITFGTAPSGLRFASPSELEEHQLLTVPAGGSTSLSYVYSISDSLAEVTALALAAQDRFEPAAVRITSPASGTTVSTPTVMLAGTAQAGSGIKSLLVGGQAVPLDPGGAWSTQIALNPGANTITALATDGAGTTTQAQVTVVYQPPSPPPPPSPPQARCKVPRLKGMKLPAAEKALRRAHCRVGKVKHAKSHNVGRGRVMSTTPPAGRKLRAGSRVEVVISKGP